MKSNYKSIGELVDRIDERNKDGSITTLIGVSIDKRFIPSVANVIGTDLTTYKVIRKYDFAVSLMQVSRDEKIPVACQKEYDAAIMSPAYPIFRVKDENVILPEYLEMWFMRSEFDREASFVAVGGVRGSMPWEEFAKLRLPVPNIEVQRDIVSSYKTITDRITLKKQINDNLAAIAQAVFEDCFAEYYIGTTALPSGWKKSTFADVCQINGGKRLPAECEFANSVTSHPYVRIRDMYQGKYLELMEDFEYIDDEVFSYIKKYIVSSGDVIIAIVGITSGEIAIIGESLDGANLTENCVKLTNFKGVTAEYLYCYWQYLRKSGGVEPLLVGAAQPKLPMYNIQAVPVIVPDAATMTTYQKSTTSLAKAVINNMQEIKYLREMQQLIVTRLSSC